MMRAPLLGAVVATTAVVAVAFGQGGEQGASIPAASPVDVPGCSPVSYGGSGRPDYLIAASTVLQGRAAEFGVQGVQALKLVLAQRGWQAGRFSVGLQICDEMEASRGLSSPMKCWRNARAFARNRGVLGVLGAGHSECALEMLPDLNRAPGGPLVLIGASPTYVGLTRAGPGIDGRDPERNFPTGQRSFVRVVPADDVQGAAGAMFVKRQHARNVFVLNDCCTYGFGVAEAFRTAAERLGLQVIGYQQWDPYAGDYRALAELTRRAGADAVYLGGYLESNGLRLIEDLRAALGPEVTLLGSDGFAAPDQIVEGAGQAAEGFAWTFAGPPNNKLSPAGREFADRFEERFQSRPRTFSLHTAQAAKVLLDAIANSDGSRAEVTERVVQTRVEDGLLGDFEFDRYGDTTLNTIGVYEIEDGRLRFKTAISDPTQRVTER
jgi:branched-chain amino acid transport system substrate-binding protein